MFSFRAFDAFNAAILASPYTVALAERVSLSRQCSDLVQLYTGNGKPYVEQYLTSHIADKILREGSLRLATTVNATALVNDQVATTGLVRINWRNRVTKELDRTAQENWERLLTDWCSSDWDSFTQSVNRYYKLLKTVVAGFAWDARRRRLTLSHYGPHEMDVAYEEGSTDKLNPDRYVYLKEEASGWLEQWQFSAGGTTRFINEDGADRAVRSEAGAFPVLDPTHLGEPVIPFVRFATSDSGSFFAYDGQQDAIDAAQFIDVCWTSINVLREFGLVVVPLLKGDGWADEEGKIRGLIFDLLRPLKQPSPDHGVDASRAMLEFLRPGVEPVIEKILSVVAARLELMALRNGLSARAVLSGGEATSGYSLQIEGASQRQQHIRDVARDTRPWARYADGMRWYWNHHCPGPDSWKIPEDVFPDAIIPKSMAVVPTREGVDSSIGLVNSGLLQPLVVIYDSDPGIEVTKAFSMAAAVEARLAQGTSLLDSVGSAGARAPQPNARQTMSHPPSGTPPPGSEPRPGGPTVAPSAGSAPVAPGAE